MFLKNMFNPTMTRVHLHTKPEINAKIEDGIHSNVDYYKDKSSHEITGRLQELEYEWDTDRVIGLSFAVMFLYVIMKSFKNKTWLLLATTICYYFFKYLLNGKCPQLSIIRKLGVRTPKEIFKEKNKLERLL